LCFTGGFFDGHRPKKVAKSILATFATFLATFFCAFWTLFVGDGEKGGQKSLELGHLFLCDKDRRETKVAKTPVAITGDHASTSANA